MKQYESFGDCLKRCLKENGISASEAARLVGFRSRNSMFRILSGEAGVDVKLRFLEKLRESVGNTWPDAQWLALQESLSVERVGEERYRANRAFSRVLQSGEGAEAEDYTAHFCRADGQSMDIPVGEVLKEVCGEERAELIITGCCESGISRMIADVCGKMAERGRLTVRQYIDTAEECITQNIPGRAAAGVKALVQRAPGGARLLPAGDDGCLPAALHPHPALGRGGKALLDDPGTL